MHINKRTMPIHPLLPQPICSERNYVTSKTDQTPKPVLTFPKTEKPVIYNEPGAVLETLAVYSCVNQWSSLVIITINIKPFFCMVHCSKNICWRSRQFGTSAEVSSRHFGTGTETLRHWTFRHQSDGAEMSWV